MAVGAAAARRSAARCRARALRHRDGRRPAATSRPRDGAGARRYARRARCRRCGSGTLERGPRAARLHGQRDRGARSTDGALHGGPGALEDLDARRAARAARRARSSTTRRGCCGSPATRRGWASRSSRRPRRWPSPRWRGGALATVTPARLGAELRLLLREPRRSRRWRWRRGSGRGVLPGVRVDAGAGRARAGADCRADGRADLARSPSCRSAPCRAGARGAARRARVRRRASATSSSPRPRRDGLDGGWLERSGRPRSRRCCARACRRGGRAGRGAGRAEARRARWLDDLRHRASRSPATTSSPPASRRARRSAAAWRPRSTPRLDGDAPDRDAQLAAALAAAAERWSSMRLTRHRRPSHDPRELPAPVRAATATTSALELPGGAGAVHDPPRRRLEGPFASLNLGRLTDDDADARRREPRSGSPPRSASRASASLYGRQVHGATVSARHRAARRRRGRRRRGRPGDRAASDARRARLRRRLPAGRAGRADGAVARCTAAGAGWRTAIVAEGVAALRELGADGPITAAIGPARARLLLRGRRGGPRRRSRRTTRAAASATSTSRRRRATQLAGGRRRRGPRRRPVHDLLRPALFFSHRRDGGVTGRQAGVVWRA